MENCLFVTDDLSVLKFEKDFKRGLNIWRPAPFKDIYIYIYILEKLNVFSRKWSQYRMTFLF